MRAPQPPQLNSTADLQALCTEQLGLCVIGVLTPGVAAHSRHLDNLGAIAMQDSGKVGEYPDRLSYFYWVSVDLLMGIQHAEGQ
jgi:hypothetical protein